MTRRTVAIIMGPMPLVAWWASREPVDLLAWSLVALLCIASTAGCGLWAVKCCTVPHLGLAIAGDVKDGESAISDIPADTKDTESGISGTPVQILATVPGVDVAELMARVERLEHQAAWVAGGVEDIETFVNLPDPDPDVLAFLEQLDEGDHAAG